MKQYQDTRLTPNTQQYGDDVCDGTIYLKHIIYHGYINQ
jgi:hypothetical protein